MRLAIPTFSAGPKAQTSLALLIAMTNLEAVVAQCPAHYSVEIFAGPDCPILPSVAGARGISDTGAICGGYLDCGEVGHPVIWSPTGEITEIPPSSDPGYPGPLAINSAGQVVGTLYVPSLLPTPDRAFLYSDGVTINLGALPGHTWSEALAINSSGVVVGWSLNGATGPLSSFVWHDGKMSALPLPTPIDFSSTANDISDSGYICGWMATNPPTDPNGAEHPFIYDLTTGETVDVGILLPGSVRSIGTGINNAGIICGFSAIPCGELCFVRKGFIWSSGTAQDLGVLPGKTNTRPQAINDSNVIVGYCNPDGEEGFVWQNGFIHALDDLVPPELNLIVRTPWDINNAGQIVASAGFAGNFDQLAVRLTPIPSPTGDFNGDCVNDYNDILNVIERWHSPGGPADFNADNDVNTLDLIITIQNWTG